MKTMIRKITLLMSLFAITLASAQELTAIPSNGGFGTPDNSRTVTDWLYHGVASNSNSIGNTAAFSVGNVIKLTTTMLIPHAGRQIEELKFFISDASVVTGDFTVDIYTDPLSLTPDYTETHSVSSIVDNDWTTIVLATPYQISGTDELYVGYSVNVSGGYPVGCDAGPAVPGMNFYSWNGGAWSALESAVDYNYNIQAGIGGATGNDDIGMLSINMEDIIVGGIVDIEGTLVNLGANNLNSVDVNWQVDGGTIYTETFSGLDLITGESLDFMHNDTWTTTHGLHSLNLWVSNMNGMGADENPANDNLMKDINVASNSTSNIPLFEEFTSSTCAPCAWFNGTHFNAFIDANASNLSLIKYQMDWPGSGDIYYTAEGGVRQAYYGVSGVPTTILDGNDPNFFGNPTLLQPEFDAALVKPAYFSLIAGFEVNGDDVTVEAVVNPFIEGNYSLHIAVVEKITTGNVGSNGETQFEHVMMKMLPDASGTAMNFTLNTLETVNYSHDMSTTNVEEMSDLAVIVFIQDDTTKEVMQSVTATEGSIGVDETAFQNVSVYPNPTVNSLNIKNAEGLILSMYDILGRELFVKQISSSEAQINVANFSEGTYIVKFTDGVKVKTKKIVIAR